MKRILLITFMLVSALVTVSLAQTRSVTGTVTSAEDGSTLPGVNVILQGTTTGTVTDIDGNYRLTVPEEGGTLTFTFIGLATQEVAIGARSVVDVVMQSDVEQLDEVVVTGVGTETSVKKLTISVAQVDEDLIQTVPAVNAASALQGKVAGVRVTSGGGAPGSAPDIRLRGATTISGSQSPLIIIDGVISEGTLADINAQDIETMEVVKGAAASSIYGSRAANGVVNIKTKRGAGLKAGTTEIMVRNELGQSFLPRTIPINTSHNRFVPEGETLDFGVHGTTTPDMIFDEKYPVYNNYQEDLFDPGMFYSNYIRIAGKSGNTNFSLSGENQSQAGVVDLVDGYKRQNIRLNADHYAFDGKLVISASNFYSQSTDDGFNSGDGSVLFDLLKLPPNQDVTADNADGQPYKWDLNPSDPDAVNPLYDIHFRDVLTERKRNMNNFSLLYHLTDWLKVESEYGLDNIREEYEEYIGKDYRAGNADDVKSGYYERFTSERKAETFRVNTYASRSFGDFDIGLRLSYLYESNQYQDFGFNGNDWPFANLKRADALRPDQYQFDLESYETEVTAENYFAVFNLGFKDKYLFDALYRRDGSSLFGENERYADFYRVSGAWRISEDFAIPGIQELKVRASLGTAGNRPPFLAQYERYDFTGSKVQTGNANLKREIAQELEVGVNASFLNRFSFEANYSITNTSDLILSIPLPVHYGGYGNQYQNAADLESKVLELSLGANIIKRGDFSWDAGIVFDRVRNTITKMNTSFLRVGPNPNTTVGQGLFYLTEGNTYGEMWGNVLMSSYDQLNSEQDPDDYVLNSDGYLVLRSQIGTTAEAPLVQRDDLGNAVYTKIGDSNPDFTMGFNTTLKWKGFSIFGVLDWKQGGDVYNQTKQWMFFNAGTHGEQDMSGKPQNLKKPGGYYQNGLYNANNPVDYFVEDGSFLKLREVAIYYTLSNEKLSNLGLGFIQSVRIGAVGRNLAMLTGYTGYDPEVARTSDNYDQNLVSSNNDAGGDSSIFSYDGFSYPNLRTFTGSLTITF